MPEPPRSTRYPFPEEDNNIAAQIKQIQFDEQESNLERAEYDIAISERLSEIEAAIAGILIEIWSAKITTVAEG
jgi:hypothetical protein